MSYALTFGVGAVEVGVTASDHAGNGMIFTWSFRQRGKSDSAGAGATIAAAEQTIFLAEELIGNSKASEVLLANVKEHLDAAKKAYNEGKYEKAYRLATSEKAGPKCTPNFSL